MTVATTVQAEGALAAAVLAEAAARAAAAVPVAAEAAPTLSEVPMSALSKLRLRVIAVLAFGQQS